MWTQAASALVGVALMVAPAVLGYGGGAADLHRIVGPTAAAVAVVALWAVTRPVRWVNLAMGIALVAAPLLLAHTTAAAAAGITAGVALAALAPAGRADPSRYGGGWSSLLGDPERRGERGGTG